MFFHRLKTTVIFSFLRKGLYSLPNTKNRPSDDLLTSEKEKIRYGKCIGCPDIGPRCGAGNLLNLPIHELRSWLRIWRLYFDLSIEQCSAAWDIPYGTTVRVLSDSDSDFKYSTMHHIVKNVVRYGFPADQEFSDNPCPATSSEISRQIQRWQTLLEEKEKECEKLRQKNTEKDEKYIQQMAVQRNSHIEDREVRERSIAYLRGQAERLQKDVDDEKAQSADYLKRIDEKNATIDEQQKVIAELNKTILDITRENERERRRANLQKSFIVLLFVITLVALTSYLVWDLMHPGAGLILYWTFVREQYKK